MRFLLDTHTFLWAIWEPSNLSLTVQTHFLDKDTVLFLSAASYWELCIKQSLGRLGLDHNWAEVLQNEMTINRIQWLNIAKEHCETIIDLPQIHGDPFDRLLIAQAQHEGLTIMTKDSWISQYPVETLW